MKTLRNTIIFLLLSSTISIGAQQISTLYFLDNSPYRHTINPAFQPVSKGYINILPFGFYKMGIGNNALTLSDILFTSPLNNVTITPLHPDADKSLFLKALKKNNLLEANLDLTILGFGFRVRENGYAHFSISEKINVGATLPRGMFDFMLGGGIEDLNATNTINLSSLGLQASIYTEVGLGYSHKINDQWTVGGKLKLLIGTAYLGMTQKTLQIDANTEEWRLQGLGDVQIGAPLDFSKIPTDIGTNGQTLQDFSDKLQQSLENLDYMSLIKPAGMGAAFDLGMTYKPIEQLQISAGITDLGFIHWNKSISYQYAIDTVYNGVGNFEYNDYVVDGAFNADSLSSDIINNLTGLADAISLKGKRGFTRMINANLNVGVDANFWDNRIGLGILSNTRLYNNRLYEEVTIGAALRPCNWFNLAVSYSLLHNGKYSNIGAGISLMPYDGINITLLADYIPTNYAAIDVNGKPIYAIPYKTSNFNIGIGFSIVWGTNKKKKDSDKDGIWDNLDMCPNTPVNVTVDNLGCPLDSDGDGVADYLDRCAGTPMEAYGLIDDNGCPLDSDNDGVADYLDKCPDTPMEAFGFVDDKGCAIDTDEDGVADWKDECPNTPKDAKGYVNEWGCENDTDQDGVPDWRDQCPQTPIEAISAVNANGCEIDTDKDGVPDWKDQCPNTPIEAKGFVDTMGCEIDTDQDGVADWKDQCPKTPGSITNNGCPEMKKEVRNLLQKAMQGIEFETGKAIIKKSSYALLDEIATTFIENPSYIIEIQGHTDNVGNADMNKELSYKRANAVREYFISKGVDANRMTARGYGMEQPIADNNTKAGRAKNRRVQFEITYETISYEITTIKSDEQVNQIDNINNY